MRRRPIWCIHQNKINTYFFSSIHTWSLAKQIPRIWSKTLFFLKKINICFVFADVSLLHSCLSDKGRGRQDRNRRRRHYRVAPPWHPPRLLPNWQCTGIAWKATGRITGSKPQRVRSLCLAWLSPCQRRIQAEPLKNTENCCSCIDDGLKKEKKKKERKKESKQAWGWSEIRPYFLSIYKFIKS